MTEADIDGNLRGVFRVMIKLGMLEPAASDPYSRIGTEAQANGSTDDPWAMAEEQGAGAQGDRRVHRAAEERGAGCCR